MSNIIEFRVIDD